MTSKIVEKLQREVSSGLNTETQVVYLLAGVRKLIEREKTSEKFAYLEFHCNWALHAKLRGSFAQKVLSHFDVAHLHLLNGTHIPPISEAWKISSMEQFKKELSIFMRAHSINDFSERSDEWPRFLYLYARVIEDIPLEIREQNNANIKSVLVSVEWANELHENHQFFDVIWNIAGADGRTGSMTVRNAFEVV